MALTHTGEAHFYECSECGGTFDLKHNDHECETRDEAIQSRDEGKELARKLLAALDGAHDGNFFAGRKTPDADAFAELADWADYDLPATREAS